MFEIVFLGTSAAAPSVKRNLSAHVVLYKEHRFLVDCGEGTQRQLLKSGLGFRRLDAVLLTHGDIDHVLGIGGLASTLALLGAGDRLTVYGGVDARRAVHQLIHGVIWPGGRPPLKVAAIALEPGVILDNQHLRLRAFPVSHRATDAFGFLFEVRSRRRMLPEQLDRLGVPPGPERGRLLDGEPVILADGRRITPAQVLAPPEPGARLAVVGDTDDANALVAAVRGADALIIEATFLERDAAKAAARGHITAAQAARLAATAEVGALHLNHISGRYPAAEIEAEARAIFPNAKVTSDFDRVEVRARGGAEHGAGREGREA
jgi:ribonuclease Z